MDRTMMCFEGLSVGNYIYGINGNGEKTLSMVSGIRRENGRFMLTCQVQEGALGEGVTVFNGNTIRGIELTERFFKDNMTRNEVKAGGLRYHEWVCDVENVYHIHVMANPAEDGYKYVMMVDSWAKEHLCTIGINFVHQFQNIMSYFCVDYEPDMRYYAKKKKDH